MTPRLSGRTAAAWEHDQVERVRTEAGERAWQSGTSNSHYVARWLEYGVGRHDLELTVDGRPVRFEHPGFGGRHLTWRAAAVVEAELDTIIQPRLSAWAAGLEANASRKR